VCPEAGKRPRRGTKSTAKTAVSGNLSLKNTLPNPTIFLPPANQAPAQSFPKRGPGRPKELASVTVPKKRILTPEAKAKIADAQKKRWAKARKAAKKAAKAESAA